MAFKRWNLDNLLGIEILKENPTSNSGTFTSAQQNYIEGKINASDDIRLLFEGLSKVPGRLTVRSVDVR